MCKLKNTYRRSEVLHLHPAKQDRPEIKSPDSHPGFLFYLINLFILQKLQSL